MLNNFFIGTGSLGLNSIFKKKLDILQYFFLIIDSIVSSAQAISTFRLNHQKYFHGFTCSAESFKHNKSIFKKIILTIY